MERNENIINLSLLRRLKNGVFYDNIVKSHITSKKNIKAKSSTIVIVDVRLQLIYKVCVVYL